MSARPIILLQHGVIAQMGERLNGIQEVRSSILLSSTNSKSPLKKVGFLSNGGIAQLGERMVRNH